MIFDVIVEIPKGSKIKYEIDHSSNRLRLDRVLFTSMQYPIHYGYVDKSLGQDGDPLDALLLLNESLFPNILVEARNIGMCKMTDESGIDSKILTVPNDLRWNHLKDIHDISSNLLNEIKHFFFRYKDLEPNKWVNDDIIWKNKKESSKEIVKALKRKKEFLIKRNLGNI